MSDWTSLNEIMRDLSMAQGRNVPASLAILHETQPPPMNIKEETEEEYYKTCGNIDLSNPPDYNLIQEMLSLVTHKNDSENHTPLESRLSPSSPELIPHRRIETSIIRKKRTMKNVAIQSILEAQKEMFQAEQPNLLNPTLSMFKRKITPNIGNERLSVPSRRCTDNKICQYTPSELADEYYNKYVSNAKLKKQVQKEIEARAESQMKEIKERKARITVSSCSSRGLSDDSSNSSKTSACWDYISLSSGRHLSLDSIEDCVVCNVAAKHGYSFKEEVS